MGLSDLDFQRIENMVKRIVDKRISENLTETFNLRPGSSELSGERDSPLQRSLGSKTKSHPATLKDYLNRLVEKKLQVAQKKVEIRT